ncbi:MAG: glycosyltransferase family 39 protein [Sedimenticola sp.]
MRRAGERWIRHNPDRLFWGFLVLHILSWTLLPALLNANLPLDVIEALAWGREWQWGFHKHPPMSAWLAELAGQLSGGADWGLYLLSQLCVAVAFWSVWQLSRDFLNPMQSLISVLLLESIAYHTLTSPEFNVNVSLLAFWALTLFTFWRAVSRDSTGYWIACGLFAGLGFLSKYLAVFLLVPLLLFLVADRLSRKSFRSPGLYLGAAVFILVIAPHMAWIWQNDFITLTYGLRRAGSGAGASFELAKHLLNPLKFLASQLVLLLPTLLLLWALGSIRMGSGDDHDARQTRFLRFAFIGPFACYLLLSALTGMQIRSMWGTTLFIPAGLFIVYHLKNRNDWRLDRFIPALIGVMLLLLSLYSAAYLLSPEIRERGKRTHFPGEALAAAVTAKWHETYHQPLRFVVGDEWLGGNVGWYSSDRPSVYLDADRRHAPWIIDRQLSEAGGVILWSVPGGNAGYPDEKIESLNRRFGRVIPQPPLSLAWQTPTPIPGLTIGWALIPPGEER